MENFSITLARYRNYLTEEEKSPATIEKYIRDASAFYEWLDGREADKPLVLKYKESLMGRYAAASVNSVISSLNSLFEYLGRRDCRVRTIKIQRSVFADKRREITRSEYERLLRAARGKGDKRLFYIMQTICASGIRVSELRYITAAAVAAGRADIRCKGKNRTVFLPGQLCKMLSGYIRDKKIKGGCVFITKSGKPVDRSNIWREMQSLCAEAGVDRTKVFPHNLRHLFARTFYSLQKDIIRLADILGHSSVNTTRIYTMESGDTHRRQIEKMNLLLC